MEVIQDVKSRVYNFGDKQADGNSTMKNLLGGKGANLAEMSAIGIPVPPGFTITTEVCTEYNTLGEYSVIELIRKDVEASVKRIEKIMGTKFGDTKNPLLLSVRSGARVSMPGMMDTVLNLGINDEAVIGLAKKTKNEKLFYLNQVAVSLASMIGNLINTIDPEFIVLGGGVVLNNKLFTKNLIKYSRDFIIALDAKKMKFHISKLKKNTGLIGAGLLHREII